MNFEVVLSGINWPGNLAGIQNRWKDSSNKKKKICANTIEVYTSLIIGLLKSINAFFLPDLVLNGGWGVFLGMQNCTVDMQFI